MATAKATAQPLDQDKSLSAVLALLVAEREERLAGNGAEPRKSEIVLAAVGLTASEIASVMGKTPDAVTKTLQRSRMPKKGTSGKR